MYLETDRLIIRDFTREDAAALHEIFGDEETMVNCEPAYDFEKTKKFLEEFCIGRKGAAAAVRKEDGKLIGYILFKSLGEDPGEDVYEIGWIFNRTCWRQGYAYEACSRVLDYAFEALHAHKVMAEAIDGVKSVSLMKKLGMKLEGIQRSHTGDNRGGWADLYLYGMLQEDR
ncbi:MAG: GNAT family N-acetyltransferase [Oscillospiraceae bacterium]|nr:GNAT family N-acetyltransferase [Oscillospiraceae bacterium]